MEPGILKEKIKDYMAEKYYTFLDIAEHMTKDRETAVDLLHTTLLEIMERETNLHKLEKAYKDNLFVYIFVALKFQYFSKNSKFHKLYRDVWYFDGEINDIADVVEKEDEFIEEVIELLEAQNIFWYDKKVWLYYWFNEWKMDPRHLKNYSREEVFKMRNISYRKLQDDLHIPRSSLNTTVLGVNEIMLEKIKRLYEKDRNIL